MTSANVSHSQGRYNLEEGHTLNNKLTELFQNYTAQKRSPAILKVVFNVTIQLVSVF